MKKSLIFVSLITSLMSATAWADPVNFGDIQDLKTTAHEVEIGLQNKDRKVVCAGMERLNELSTDLILYKSAPDEATAESLQKLISLNTSTEKFMASCENPGSQSPGLEVMPEIAPGFFKKTFNPALHAVEKSLRVELQVASSSH